MSRRVRGENLEAGGRAKRRRRNDAADVEESDTGSTSSEDDGGILMLTKDLMSRNGLIHSVTPLQGFDESENALKRYARRLTSEVGETTAGIKAYSVHHTELKFFPQMFRDPNFSALHISVLSKDEFAVDEENEALKTVFRLLIVMRERRQRHRNSTRSSHCVISRGPEAIFKGVKRFIEEQFQCMLFPIRAISPADVKVIFGNWLMKAWREDTLDLSSSIIIQFPSEIEHGKTKWEGSIRLACFLDYFEANGGEAGNPLHSVFEMWHSVLSSITGEIPLNFFTPARKISYKSFMISGDGRIKANSLTESQYSNLFSSLDWMINEGFKRSLLPAHRRNIV